MPRRKAYTRVEKRNFKRPAHVKGKGDVLFRGFQCLNRDCTHFIFSADDEITDDFSIRCPICRFVHAAGKSELIYDYNLRDKRDGSIIEKGTFETLHDDYVREAKPYKYCIICSTLKPLDLFDKHKARKSAHQGECNLCKQLYNSIKNQTRLAEQHREASQKRRPYTELTNSPRIDIGKIYEKFGSKCFKCKKDLSADRDRNQEVLRGNLDHTLPVRFLWPMTTDNATLLCKEHNGAKAEKWPGDYYTDAELKRLAPLVGIEYRTLKKAAHFNPAAIERLRSREFVEDLFVKYALYFDELILLRNKILSGTKFDFFRSWPQISADLVRRADELRRPAH